MEGSSQFQTVHILLKVPKFGIKTFKLCESSTRYLWNLIIYTEAGTDITASIDVPDIRTTYRAPRLLSDLYSSCQPRIQFVGKQLLQFTISV